MKPLYKAMAVSGEYEQNGETKKRWLQCGVAFEKEGRLSLKLDALPVNFEGWISMFPFDDERKEDNARGTTNPTKNVPLAVETLDQEVDLSEIPF